MSITLLLKFVCPVIVLSVVWIWDRMRRKKRMREKKEVESPYLEFSALDDKVREDLSGLVRDDVLDKLDSNTKVYRIMLKDQTIALALFSWPSSLWHFRVERGEEIDLGAYSHIHWLWVSEGYRKGGYLYKLMDNIISDTHRISAGLTIDLKDPELKSVFKRKFEFEDAGEYMKLGYGNWG